VIQRTFATRLSWDAARDPLLDAYANLYGRAERTLFARLRTGRPLAATKREFLVRFGLTARQFNALAASVRGKITAIQTRRPGLIATLERRIERAQTVLAKTPKNTRAYHQKQRRLAALQQRGTALKGEGAVGTVRLCFGSRTLFRGQFALAANGYASHNDWRRAWREARSNQFFVIGSKDETAGCQGCVATVDLDGTITLRLRLPNAFAACGKYVVISGLRFRYGHQAVAAAIGRNLSPDQHHWEALCWRFVRDRKGWRVLATVSVHGGTRRSIEHIGMIGVDLNADHLAVTDVDRFGNPIASFRVPCRTRGTTHHQARAIIGDAVRHVVTYAYLHQKPIVAERLQFDEKKAALEQRGARYARMLSGFAYATLNAILTARCYDAGIALRHVNPAFTSVIGAHTVANRYGLSRHHAAACAIGRRGMHLAERPPRRLGDHVTFPLPVRNRGKHVWSFWRQVARREAALRAHGRPGPTGARSSPAPAPGSPRSAARPGIHRTSGSSAPSAGGTPAREPSAILFG